MAGQPPPASVALRVDWEALQMQVPKVCRGKVAAAEKVISGAARFEVARSPRPARPRSFRPRNGRSCWPARLAVWVRNALHRGLHGEISLSGEAGRPPALPPGPPPARILLLRGKGEPFPSRSACCYTERVHSLARGLLLQIPPLTLPTGHRHLPTSAARAAVAAANRGFRGSTPSRSLFRPLPSHAHVPFVAAFT